MAEEAEAMMVKVQSEIDFLTGEAQGGEKINMSLYQQLHIVKEALMYTSLIARGVM